ncbi:MAG: GtrA family protein [Sphingobium sp.]|nr:GtrA family protein [Sphingobium sp.]
MQRLSAILANTTFLRYGLGSAVALSADVGMFTTLLAFGLPSVPASSLGYMFGILVHWLISSRLVFASGTAAAGPARTRQKALFVAAALVGLALTTAIMAAAGVAGLSPLIAKLIAIVVSFQTTYLLRKSFVFTA